MTLKRRFLSMIAVLFALTFVAGACSDDDDASTDTDTEETTVDDGSDTSVATDTSITDDSVEG